MKFLTLLVLLIFGFSSCEDQNADQFLPATGYLKITAFGLSDTEIDNIGKLHNEVLISSYEGIELVKPENKAAHVREHFYNLDLDIHSTGYDAKSLYDASEQWYHQSKENNFLIRNENLNTAYLNKYLELIYDELSKTTSIQDFEGRMNNLEASLQGDDDLKLFEIEAIKVSISIAKNSAGVWMPTSMGGIGLTSNGIVTSIEKKWNWGGMVLGDISGAMSVMAELGVAGAVLGTVPGTNAAIGVAVAVSSGIGSAIGGLT